MHWPYTLEFLDSYNVAQWGSAMLLTALLFYWRLGWAARLPLLAGIWLAAVANMVPGTLGYFFTKVSPDTMRTALLVSVSLGTLAATLALRPVVAVTAALGQLPLWWLTGFITHSEGELAALHLSWLGLLVGLLGRRPPARTGEPPRPEPEGSYVVHDAVAFALATLAAALVCVVVLQKRDGSADEWGYTYQAAVFAKGRAYAAVPRCQPNLESFYVFETSGRLFSQYTPGWPMFIVPFVWARAVWLSGPFSLGLMAWGMARLGRSAMRGFGRVDAPPTAREIRLAGTWAAALSSLSTTLLINGASRYSHVYTLALYAWALEGMAMVTTPGLPTRRKVLWGIVLGTAAVHGVAVRPADGAFVGIGIALYFLYALVRRRVGWAGFAAAALSFGLWSALMLVILRLQLGKWFTTGYSLNAVLHPWNIVKFSKPQPHEWKYGLPLATGSYCWWPTSIPLGMAGLSCLRGRARGLAVAMVVSCLAYIPFAMYLDLGQRGVDWGYGPRYLMVLVVPAAVASAVVLAPLTRAALLRVRGGAFGPAGAFAAILVALVTAWVRIAPPEWATNADHARKHSGLARAVEEAHLSNAIVIAANGTTGFADLDLTTNYPVDLYPSQPVILALDRGNQRGAVECLSQSFPGRRLYYASGVEDIRITPAN